eukprot:346454_1
MLTSLLYALITLTYAANITLLRVTTDRNGEDVKQMIAQQAIDEINSKTNHTFQIETFKMYNKTDERALEELSITIATMISDYNATSNIVPFVLGAYSNSMFNAHATSWTYLSPRIFNSLQQWDVLFSMNLGRISSSCLSFSLMPAIYHLWVNKSSVDTAPYIFDALEFAQFNISNSATIHEKSKQIYDNIAYQITDYDLLYNVSIPPSITVIYDEIYLFFYALDLYEKSHTLQSLCDNYNSDDWEYVTTEFYQAVESVPEFLGVTGPVKSNQYGWRTPLPITLKKENIFEENDSDNPNECNQLESMWTIIMLFVFIWLFAVFLCLKRRSLMRICMTIALGLCCVFITFNGLQHCYYSHNIKKNYKLWYDIWCFSNMIILSFAFTLTFPVLVSSNSELMMIIVNVFKKPNQK